MLTSSTFTANTITGSYTIDASVAGVSTSTTFSLRNTLEAPATIIVAAGSGQAAFVGTAFAAPLTSKVSDRDGNPVPGAIVTFTAPSSGASGTFANGTGTETDMTDASGLATSSTFTANTVGGTYTVDASVAGVSTPAAFTFTNRYRPPPPTLTRFTPRQGGVGVKVTVVGSNLSGATRVAFNGAPAVIRTDTATKITTWVPTGATTGPIEVTTDGGIGTSATSFRVKYLVVTPSSGAPGASVTAGGSGFKFGEPVVVKYTTGLSNPKSLQICSATAGPDGTVTCAGDIPPPSTAGVTGTHVIEATGRKSKTTVKTTFTLT